MKNQTLSNLLKASVCTLAIGLTTLQVNAAHELAYAVDVNNNLMSFYTDTPGTIISGSWYLGPEEIRGIDFSGGTLYGLGAGSHLYQIDPVSHTVTLVGSIFTPNLFGTAFGADNGAGGFQVVSDQGQSLLIDRSTGVGSLEPSLAYAAGDPHAGANPFITGLAYDSASGKWYAGDSSLNSIATLNPATGVLTTVGNAGIDFARFNGLDVSGLGTLYLASPAASSDPAANLYTVDMTTGAASLVGLIGNPGDNYLIRGLTVAVPEPGSLAILALGGLLIGFARRRN